MKESARKAQPHSDDQREFERVAISIAGTLFVPAEEFTIDCQITNLSGGGAAVKCDEPPPLNAFVVLYIEGFGRFDAVATRFVDGQLGLRFVCKEAKRQRLLKDIADYVDSGFTKITRLRRHARDASASSGYFSRANGEMIACDVIDISLQGISLRTQLRPPIGEIINLGKTCGRVARHHQDGIAIQYLNVASSNDDARHGA